MKKRVRMKAPYRLRPVIIPLGFEILHEGDVMLETHVLPHFGSGLEPAEHLGIILLKVKADEGVEFLSELLHEGGLPYLSGTSENQRLSLLAPGPSPELGHDFTFVHNCSCYRDKYTKLSKLIGKIHKIIAECIGITWVIFAQMIIIR